MNEHFFPLERNRYFYGKLLTVRDFEVEQQYNRAKRELLNRVLQGAGVVCGFGVTASDDATLMIESGLAMDYQGREIVLPETIFRKLQMLDGQETLAGGQQAYLCLTYDEAAVEPVNAVGGEAGESSQFNMGKSVGAKESVRIYEIFDGDPFEVRRLKEFTGKKFSEGVYALYSRDFTGAKKIFLDLMHQNTGDGGAKYYLYLADELEKHPDREIGLEGR